MKTEYPKLGYSYPVQHYTEFLVERLDQLKPDAVQRGQDQSHLPRPVLPGTCQ